MIYREVSFLSICVETRGIIVGWTDENAPKFQFVNPRTGENIRRINPIGGTPNYTMRGEGIIIGEQVKIIFDPNNPTHAQIKGSAILWILLLWILFCVVFTVVFAWIVLQNRIG